MRMPPPNWATPAGLKDWAIDTGGVYGKGWDEVSNSFPGMTETGFNMGTNNDRMHKFGHAEVGGFIYTSTGKRWRIHLLD